MALISGYDGILHALCSHTGEELWDVNSDAEIKGSSLVYQDGVGASRYSSTVFFGAHDKMLRCVCMGPSPSSSLSSSSSSSSSSALSSSSSLSCGDVLWEIELDGAVYASPLIVRTTRKDSSSGECLELLIVATTNGTLYSFDLTATTKRTNDDSPASLSSSSSLFEPPQQPPCLLWRVSTPGPLFATPIACGVRHIIIIATVSGSISCLNLLTGVSIWTRMSNRGYFSSPMLYPPMTNHRLRLHTDNSLSESSNNLSCHSDVIGDCLDDLIVIGCHDGCLSCRDIKTGVRKWYLDLSSMTTIGDVIFSSPFIFKSSSPTTSSSVYVAVATQTGLIVIVNLHSGKLLHSLTLPGQIFSSPVVLSIRKETDEENESIVSTEVESNDFVLYIGCRDDHVYAIDIHI